jgi:ABC-2 type transport system permease protein
MSLSMLDTTSDAEGRPVPYGDLGRPIRGPRALSDDWTRFWHLAFNIAVMQWKTRFFGSVLGYFWQLVRPLLLFGVLYLFFTVVARVGQGDGPSGQFYGTQLLGSIVLFTFFQEATMGSVRSVVDNESLVRKIQFPRLVIPLSVVLLSLFNLSLNLVIVLIFGLIQGVHPMMSWLELPLLLLMLALLTSGVAMLLSALFPNLRDLQPIWEVVLQVLFYASPVIVPLEVVAQKLGPAHEWLLHIYMANPVTAVLQQFRHAMVTHAATSAENAIGGIAYLMIPLAITLAVFVLGFWVFNRTAPRVAEDL